MISTGFRVYFPTKNVGEKYIVKYNAKAVLATTDDHDQAWFTNFGKRQNFKMTTEENKDGSKVHMNDSHFCERCGSRQINSVLLSEYELFRSVRMWQFKNAIQED